MNISKNQLSELSEIIEDTVEYFCDKEQISGELAWTCVESLSTTKITELKGNLLLT